MPYPLFRIIHELVLPPLGPFVLLLFAYAIRLRRRRISLGLAAAAAVWMLAFSLPGTYRWLNSPWPDLPERIEPPYPPADAIVVLGGGRYLNAPEYGGDTANSTTLMRLRYAAKLHRETGAPILVSGGRPGDSGRRSEAEIMEEILRTDYAMKARWVEPNAVDTRSNAQLSSVLLNSAKVSSIYLVTNQSHMPRARAEFEATGLSVVPMSIQFQLPDEPSIHLWIPSYYGLSLCRQWLQEKMAPFNPF